MKALLLAAFLAALGPRPARAAEALPTAAYLLQFNESVLAALELAQTGLREDGEPKLDRAKFPGALARFRSKSSALSKVAPEDPALGPAHNELLRNLHSIEQCHSLMDKALASGRKKEAYRHATRAMLFSRDLLESFRQFRRLAEKSAAAAKGKK